MAFLLKRMGILAAGAAGGGGWTNVNSETDLVVAQYATAPSDARQELMDNLIGTLKSEGLWTILDCLYLMAAGEETGARVNWKTPGSYSLTNRGSGNSFTVDSGFDCNGNGNLNTGWNLRNTSGNIAYNASCMGIWTGHTGQIGSPSAAMGANPSGGSVSGILITPRKDNNTFVTKLNGFSNFSDGGLVAGGDGGLWHISRYQNTSYNTFRRGVYDSTHSSTGKTPMVAENVTIGGSYTTQYTIISKLRAAYFGGDFNPGDDTAMEAALKTYMDDVVGGY